MGRRGKGSYEIPLAPIERIIHQEGGYRVSEDAAVRLREIVEKFAREVARVSVDMARHANRHTVKAEDIDVALKVVLSRVQGFLGERPSS
ncbi:MAG: NFYB/HAP3 family transcription factor subunit [Thermofilaceae archaeon]